MIYDRDFHKWRWRMTTTGFVVSMIVLGFLVGGLKQQADTNTKNTQALQEQAAFLKQQSKKNAVAGRALCTFERDLERRIVDGEKFLRQHPNGIPGIPARTIRTSLKNQRATVNSLRELRCKQRRLTS